MIFACMLGGVVSLIAIPQVVIFLALFWCAGLLYPLTTPEMIDDFKAAGGFIMLATAFRMMQVKIFPTADMIPAMVLVFPVSWCWKMCIRDSPCPICGWIACRSFPRDFRSVPHALAEITR